MNILFCRQVFSKIVSRGPWAILMVGLVSLPAVVHAETTSLSPFTPGEKISYDIKKFGLDVGDATLTFNGLTRVNNQDVYRITFVSSAMNFYDEERIFVDTKNFQPVRVERDLNIFGRKEKISEDYDPIKGEIRVKKQAGGKVTEQVLTKSGNIDNIYGFIYRYRRDGNFVKGDVLNLRLPTKDVAFKLKEDVRLSAGGKVFDAARMESNPKKYEVWFERGGNRIPLRIDGAVGLASTSMVFSEYDSGAVALSPP